jgi:hypothetical protein
MAVGFSKEDAGRIGVVVKRVEHSPLGARSYRSKHKIFRGTGGGEYDGPFAVATETTTSVRIYGYNLPEGREFRSYIILGTSRIEFTEAVISSITVTGWLYLNIVFSVSTYSSTAVFAAALPAQDNTHIYHPLAHIVCVGGVISSIMQLQYGEIHFPARVL